jgi:hypothetical protein
MKGAAQNRLVITAFQVVEGAGQNPAGEIRIEVDSQLQPGEERVVDALARECGRARQPAGSPESYVVHRLLSLVVATVRTISGLNYSEQLANWFAQWVDVQAKEQLFFISEAHITVIRGVVQRYFAKEVSADYTDKTSPSSPAVDTSQQGMADELHRSVLAARRLASYEVLARDSDLTNPKLPEAVKRQREGNLLSAYDRVQEIRPDFKDTNGQLTAARRIQKAAYRERQRAKRGLGPAVRGRPRKLRP